MFGRPRVGDELYLRPAPTHRHGQHALDRIRCRAAAALNFLHPPVAPGQEARRRLGRVKTPDQRNPAGDPGVVPHMDPIHEMQVSEPGLVVVDVAAVDEETAFAFQQLLADQWATATTQRTTRDAGEPGVRLRCYLDLRQPAARS
ncbi:DUF6207 family protein [Streptomyces sp. NPDC096040]|uniref:DUF6207 family protein n=1 Tax=Streptomyces sp. NPDC096040 TaxID=3155541 RepID=UPI003320AC41